MILMINKNDLSQYSMEELTALSVAIEKERTQRRKDRFNQLVDAYIMAHEDLCREFPFAYCILSHCDDDTGEISINILDEPLRKCDFHM